MKKVSQLEVKDNVIDEFKFKHALVCARKKDGTFNMCTIAWGSIGELWSKDVITVYVKPIRHTDSFLFEDDYFTITFFNKCFLACLFFEELIMMIRCNYIYLRQCLNYILLQFH